jgi:hypothetical protein
MRLAEVRQLDEVVLLRYLLGGDGPTARGDRDPEAGGIRGGP